MRRGDVGPADARIGKRQGSREQVLHRLDHRLIGAPVGRQRAPPRHRHVARLQVGVQVRAAKAVDRLLGIADQVQRRARPARFASLARLARQRSEQTVEDAPLHRIGVLELVDQRCLVLRANRPAQRGPGRTAQASVQIAQQIRVGLHAAAVFAHLQFGLQPLTKARQQAIGRLPGRERVLVQAAQRRQQRVLRRILALVAGGAQPGRGEVAQSLQAIGGRRCTIVEPL